MNFSTGANTLTTRIHQTSGQYIVVIATRHDGLDDIEVTGPTVGVTTPMIANSIKVYPNSVKQEEAIHIRMPEELGTLSFVIYDMMDRVVMQGTLDDKTALIHSLSFGAYMLKIQLGQSVHSQKFLVQ